MWFVWLLLCVWLIAVAAGLQLEKMWGYRVSRERETERDRDIERDNKRKGDRESQRDLAASCVSHL